MADNAQQVDMEDDSSAASDMEQNHSSNNAIGIPFHRVAQDNSRERNRSNNAATAAAAVTHDVMPMETGDESLGFNYDLVSCNIVFYFRC